MPRKEASKLEPADLARYSDLAFDALASTEELISELSTFNHRCDLLAATRSWLPNGIRFASENDKWLTLIKTIRDRAGTKWDLPEDLNGRSWRRISIGLRVETIDGQLRRLRRIERAILRLKKLGKTREMFKLRATLAAVAPVRFEGQLFASAHEAALIIGNSYLVMVDDARDERRIDGLRADYRAIAKKLAEEDDFGPPLIKLEKTQDFTDEVNGVRGFDEIRLLLNYERANLLADQPGAGIPLQINNQNKVGRSWQAIKKLAEQHVRRNPFPGVKAFAKLLKCSPSTVTKAIDRSSLLRAKFDEYESARKGTARGLAVDNRRPNPRRGHNADPDAATDEIFNRLIQEAEPAERDKLHSMDSEQRRHLVATIAHDPHPGDGVRRRSR
jgi:hypothetical protein